MDVTDLVFIDSTGYHFKDYPTFLAWLQGKYQSIYGADVYLGADSQDGQFVAIVAKALYDTAALGASDYNSFSPISAQGTGLSRVVKINGLARQPATASTADLTIVGVAGTIISSGIAIDTLQQKWDLPATVTIPSGGSIVVTATSELDGATTADANTITGIFTPTLGWQSVTNLAVATVGVATESDAQLRIRQQGSTANPSLTVFEGTLGGVENLAGVTQVRGYENDSKETDDNGQDPNSIQVMVLGGDDMAIAQEIALHKTPGTETVGTTTENVTDSRGMPLAIKFTRPILAEIGVEITLAQKTGWTTDFEIDIATSVAAVVNAFGIGNNVLYTRLFAPAYVPIESNTYDLVGIRLKKNSGSFAAANVTINYNEYPECNPTTDFTFIVT